jgi:hypothetical protein
MVSPAPGEARAEALEGVVSAGSGRGRSDVQAPAVSADMSGDAVERGRVA